VSSRAPAVHGRRRLAVLIAFVALAAVAFAVLSPKANQAVNELVLPLRYENIIRQQAREKELDPALIAAVIFAESHFREGRTSSAGAEGLMQITPATASDIARRSGGNAFRVEDLHTPQVNISYGAYHLRYLLRHYGGNTGLAVAAYNAGEGNVDRWLTKAAANGEPLTVDAIPFPETRAYVDKVKKARRDYRKTYEKELGL
jgi:soluble lytic murein transglycosylase